MGQGEDSGFDLKEVGAWRAVGRGGPGPDSCSRAHPHGCGGEDRQYVTWTGAWNPSGGTRACPDG